MAGASFVLWISSIGAAVWLGVRLARAIRSFFAPRRDVRPVHESKLVRPDLHAPEHRVRHHAPRYRPRLADWERDGWE